MQENDILGSLKDCPLRSYEAGETVIKEGEETGHLYFLAKESVEIFKKGV